MSVSISLSITQNSQNIANNTSNVTVKLTASWTEGSYNGVVDANGTPQPKGWVKIDGTQYDFAAGFNWPSPTQTGSKVIYTKTVTIKHSTDGTKTLSCSAEYNTYVSSGTVKATTSKTLTTIPRKSTLSVANGTLGTSQTLTVTRQSTSFTHTIAYTCGSASGTICTKSSSTSISWTPALDLAKQNTTGTTVSVKFTITTYNGTTSVGSNTYTKTYSIPASIKPSCTVTVSDPTGYADTYGGYLKGLSKMKVSVTVDNNSLYGSTISTYRTTALGSTYTKSEFTTGVINTSGTLTVSSTVTDKRGRSGSATKSVTVLDYAAPSVSKLSASRCNIDGTANDQGEYAKVTFSYTAYSLNSKNTCNAVLEYKKTTTTSYTTPSDFPGRSGTFSVSNATYIFEADTGSSYDIRLTVTDAFKSTSKSTTVSTGATLMHWKANGKGMGIGKISELDDTLDIGFKTHMQKTLTFDNDTGVYAKTAAGSTVHLINLNNSDNTVIGYGGYNASIGATNIYGNLVNITSKNGIYVDGRKLSANKVLWSGGYYMSSNQTCTLNENISAQANGVILVWSEYTDGESVNANFNFTFVPRRFVVSHPEKGITSICSSATLNVVAAKYVYVHDSQIVGYANNSADAYDATCGIHASPKKFVLRYVIGV